LAATARRASVSEEMHFKRIKAFKQQADANGITSNNQIYLKLQKKNIILTLYSS
jgi:hypothetical protein